MTSVRASALLLLTMMAAGAAEEPLPKAVLEQIEASKPALDKAFSDYRKKVIDENNKLVALIQKAMEKSTKAGKLDEAIALKSALEKARNGDLLRDYLEPTTADLIGGVGGEPRAGAIASVTLSTNDPIAELAVNKPVYDNRDYLISEVPKELLGLTFAQRSFKEPAACTVKVISSGTLYLALGVPNDGKEFEDQGFVKTDLQLKCTTGPLSILRKSVRAGDSITISVMAITNSFPIWKAR
ncbi:MAG: hypothetical protein H0W72_00135 [Planctomycetes bacterium]|nr:hypothetical protein [Planctomycetota bacterium]